MSSAEGTDVDSQQWGQGETIPWEMTQHGDHISPRSETQEKGVEDTGAAAQGIWRPRISPCPFHAENLGITPNISKSGASLHSTHCSSPLPSVLPRPEHPPVRSSLHPKEGDTHKPQNFPTEPWSRGHFLQPEALPLAGTAASAAFSSDLILSANVSRCGCSSCAGSGRADPGVPAPREEPARL